MTLIAPVVLKPQTQRHLEQALTSIREYECWRLNRYLAIDDAKRGNIQHFGGSTALGFNDVGYLFDDLQLCDAHDVDEHGWCCQTQFHQWNK